MSEIRARALPDGARAEQSSAAADKLSASDRVAHHQVTRHDHGVSTAQVLRVLSVTLIATFFRVLVHRGTSDYMHSFIVVLVDGLRRYLMLTECLHGCRLVESLVIAQLIMREFLVNNQVDELTS